MKNKLEEILGIFIKGLSLKSSNRTESICNSQKKASSYFDFTDEELYTFLTYVEIGRLHITSEEEKQNMIKINNFNKIFNIKYCEIKANYLSREFVISAIIKYDISLKEYFEKSLDLEKKLR